MAPFPPTADAAESPQSCRPALDELGYKTIPSTTAHTVLRLVHRAISELFSRPWKGPTGPRSDRPKRAGENETHRGSVRFGCTPVLTGCFLATERQLDSIPLLGFCVSSTPTRIRENQGSNGCCFRYTSFTGCAVLLFSASQNLLQLTAEVVGQELSYASSHLNLLSYCSFDNALAKILYVKLQVIYNDIREALVSPAYREMCQTGTLVRDAALVPRSEFGSVEGTMDISRTMVDLNERILKVLCESLNF
jgi:hypothetical protein